MSPRKPSKSKPNKAHPKKAKAARRSKPASKKAGSKKAASKGGWARHSNRARKGRASVPVVFRRKGGERAAADTVDTLGEWQHEDAVDTEKYTEDDIPPDYGGSE